MKVIEHRHLFRDSLIELCVENGWYQLGSNEQYQNMLSLPYGMLGELKEVTPNLLYKIASDIREHSDLSLSVEYIMYELHQKECVYYYVEKEEIED